MTLEQITSLVQDAFDFGYLESEVIDGLEYVLGGFNFSTLEDRELNMAILDELDSHVLEQEFEVDDCIGCVLANI